MRIIKHEKSTLIALILDSNFLSSCAVEVEVSGLDEMSEKECAQACDNDLAQCPWFAKDDCEKFFKEDN